jgi:hypothetical protein
MEITPYPLIYSPIYFNFVSRDTLTDGLRVLLFNSDNPTRVLIHDLAKAAGVLRRPFAITELIDAGKDSGVSRRSVYDAFEREKAHGQTFVQKLPLYTSTLHWGEDNNTEHDSNFCTIRTGSTDMYIINPDVNALLNEAYGVLYRRLFPQSGDFVLLPELTRQIVQWFDETLTNEEADHYLDIILSDPDVEAYFDKQDRKKFSQRLKIVNRYMRKLRHMLRQMDTTPLPDDWTLQNVPKYRSAFLHAIVKATPDCQKSENELGFMVGTTGAAVRRILAAGNVASVKQEVKTIEIRKIEDISQYRGGRAFELSSVNTTLKTSNKTQFTNEEQARSWAAGEISKGGIVKLKVQPPNKQMVIAAEQPVREPRKPSVKPAPADQSSNKPRNVEPPKPYVKPSTVWATAYIENLLSVTKHIRRDLGIGAYINANGEIVTGRAVLDLFTGRKEKPVFISTSHPEPDERVSEAPQPSPKATSPKPAVHTRETSRINELHPRGTIPESACDPVVLEKVGRVENGQLVYNINDVIAAKLGAIA